MVKSKTRQKGCNVLLSVNDFNAVFCVFFNVSLLDVVGIENKRKDIALLYVYGLRKMCGLNIVQSSELLGYSNNFAVSFGIKECCKKLCLFDVSYSSEFALQWSNFRSYCRLFRKPMTAKERYQKWYKKHSNKKKRK